MDSDTEARLVAAANLAGLTIDQMVSAILAIELIRKSPNLPV